MDTSKIIYKKTQKQRHNCNIISVGRLQNKTEVERYMQCNVPPLDNSDKENDDDDDWKQRMESIYYFTYYVIFFFLPEFNV